MKQNLIISLNKLKPGRIKIEKGLTSTNSRTVNFIQAKVKDYERQIDQMVYKLYGLTEEEIKIVENQ